MADFHVRDWLADELGLDLDDLDLVDTPHTTPRGQVGRYELDSGETVIVVVTWAVPNQRKPGRRLVIATLPGGGAIEDIEAGGRVVW